MGQMEEVGMLLGRASRAACRSDESRVRFMHFVKMYKSDCYRFRLAGAQIENI